MTRVLLVTGSRSLATIPGADREAAWKALCARTEEVGKMKNAKVWLKKAIAEEDARRGSVGASEAPAPQVLGACGHCGRPATERTLAADVVCCAACWAATLRGDRIERCGAGVTYTPREEGEI